MIIKFKVPKWAIGRHIYFFAGAELLGRKRVEVTHKKGEHVYEYQPIEIKKEDGRCNGCGSCCSSVGLPSVLVEEMIKMLNNPKNNGACPLLTDIGCVMKAWTPFSCLKSVCTSYENCTEKLEMIK